MLGMQCQALLVGLDAAFEGLRSKPVVKAFDVVPLARREPVDPIERTLCIVVALVEGQEVIAHHGELRVGHREVRIDLDGLFEKGHRLGAETTFVEVDALSVVAVGLD